MIDVALMKQVKIVKEHPEDYSSKYIASLLDDVYEELIENAQVILDLVEEI